MIAAVKGWHAVPAALLFFIPPVASAADDLSSAARELARKTIAFAGRDEAVSVIWRDISSLGPSALAQARAAFEAAVKDGGIRTVDAAGTLEATITVSENQTQYLLVEEVRKTGERQVWIAAFKRGGMETAAPAASLEKKLVWEQDELMLDVGFSSDVMLVLTTSKLLVFARNGAKWELKEGAPVAASRPWSRDPRARLRVNGNGFQIRLPGTLCSGDIEPAFSVECRPSEEPWTLESGSRAMLLANFVSSRNFFDGRVTTQTGLHKTIAPFYSVASVDEQGRQLWLLALVDGRTEILDATLDAAGSIGSWGSDIAGIDTRCGSGQAVLATRTGDGSSTDAVQAFAVVNRAPVPLGGALGFPGPVVALWPSGGLSATAIVHNLATGKYEAYLLTVSCGS